MPITPQKTKNSASFARTVLAIGPGHLFLVRNPPRLREDLEFIQEIKPLEKDDFLQ
jgi:hypothetical protein